MSLERNKAIYYLYIENRGFVRSSMNNLWEFYSMQDVKDYITEKEITKYRILELKEDNIEFTDENAILLSKYEEPDILYKD
jgi:hypothetical protein